MTDVTQILHRIDTGDTLASDELLPLVYDELRRLAARELERDAAGRSWQATDLVHQAYLRLVDQDAEPQWHHRGHFYAAAARAMRRILVEHARRKQSAKRGGQHRRVAVENCELASPQQEPDLLALDEALTRLAEHRPEIAQLVNLRYFAGLTVEQAAEALGISPRTAARNWTYARAWLLEALSDSDSGGSADR
jgi:RNA polymerase sigma factor (TIGR02999 family)